MSEKKIKIVKKVSKAGKVAVVEKPLTELARRRQLFATMTMEDRVVMVKDICDAISCSEKSLSAILRSHPDWPVWTKFYEWMDEDEALRKMYAGAKRRQTEYTAERLNEIADDESGEPLINPKTGRPMLDQKGNIIYVRSQVSIAHARLRIDTRKWLMSKLQPHKYGDRTILAGDPDAPLAPKQDLSKLTKEELATLIAIQSKVESDDN